MDKPIWAVPNGVSGEVGQLVSVMTKNMGALRATTTSRERKRITRAFLDHWQGKGFLVQSQRGVWGFTLKGLEGMRTHQTLEVPTSYASRHTATPSRYVKRHACPARLRETAV